MKILLTITIVGFIIAHFFFPIIEGRWEEITIVRSKNHSITHGPFNISSQTAIETNRSIFSIDELESWRLKQKCFIKIYKHKIIGEAIYISFDTLGERHRATELRRWPR